MSYEPIVGQWYNVVCPVCYSTVNFECSSLQRYAVPCSCKALVNLRNPDVELMAEDPGKYPSDSDQTVRYSKEVDISSGLSACVQVGIIITDLEEEKSKTMPAHMGGETRQAFSMQRNQALAEKFSFLYPITYTLEYLVFGTRPVAKIGHLRIFRKHLPFYGQVNIPVPKTSPSSATPSFITFTLMIGFLWFVRHLDQGWSNGLRWVQYVLIFSFYALMYRLVYDDPGFIRPGYIDNEGGLGGELTLKDIETNQRDSRWESVNGVPMESKWCSTCEMYRPPRAAHCYLCGLCCYDHDHHCSVIGVCVGRRRLERFVAFVTVTSIGLIIPTFTVIRGLYYHSELFTQGEMHISLGLLVLLLLFGIPITLTAISMWQSVVFEASTRERMQGVYMNKRNPYDMGFFRNIYYHLCRRRVAPSLFSDTFVDLCAMRYQKRELGQGKTTTCF